MSDALNNLNVFEIEKEYKARQRDESKSRLESGELLLNPNPLLFHQELQRRVEVFENLKVTYLEQETKEKFLRSILNDPPQLVEQSDLESIRQENKTKKTALKQDKIRQQELETQLTDASRQVCMEYENLYQKSSLTQEMQKEMQAMQSEIDELTKHQEALELPKYNDPDMNLPANELQSLASEYASQKQAIDNELSALRAKQQETHSEKQNLSNEIARLERENETIQAKAQQLISQGTSEQQKTNESTAKYYQGMNKILGSLF